MKVIIVGGGIGGLATYLSLRKYMPSVKVMVYEAYSTCFTSSSVVGGAMNVGPNGLRALEAISPAARRNISARALVGRCFTMRNEYGYTLGRLWTFPETIMATRTAIHTSLLLEVPESDMVWNRKVTKVLEIADRVRVVFEDGQFEECDIVLGADGAHSVCKLAIFGEDAYPSMYEGLTSLNCFIPISSLAPAMQQGLRSDDITLTSSRDGFMGYFVVPPFAGTDPKDQQLFFWLDYATNQPPARHPEPNDACKIFHDKIKGWKSPWGNTFEDIIASARAQGSKALFMAVPRYTTARLPHWTSNNNRIILLGDAAHRMTPEGGQGASQALEDAQMIGMLLGLYLRSEADADQVSVSKALSKACKAYETMRIPRVAKVMDNGQRTAALKHQISWFRAIVRDLHIWWRLSDKLSTWRKRGVNAYNVEAEVLRYVSRQEFAQAE